MRAIIRIHGLVDISEEVENTLYRLRLRRKYSCIILRDDKEKEGMLKKIRNFVAYGEIDKKTFVELVKKRGQVLQKGEKINAEEIVEKFTNSKTEEKLDKFGIKPFFRLHPPRGGIKSKLHYPKGVLGNHGKKINDLIMRML